MKVSNTIPLCWIINLSDCALLCKMSRKKVNNLSTKKEDYQFQVWCVSYLNFLKKAFKEKVDNFLSSQIYSKTSQQMMEPLKQYNTRVIFLIVFYDKRKSLLFKVLGVVIHWLLDKYVCVEYFFLQRETKILSSHRLFEDTSFNYLSGMRIPKLLLNIFLVMVLFKTTMQH